MEGIILGHNALAIKSVLISPSVMFFVYLFERNNLEFFYVAEWPLSRTFRDSRALSLGSVLEYANALFSMHSPT